MQDNGPLIALIVFILASILFGVFAYQSHGDLQGIDPENQDPMKNTTKDAEIKRIKVDIDRYEQEIQDEEKKIALKRETLRLQNDKLVLSEQLFSDYTSLAEARHVLVTLGTGGELKEKKITGFKNEAMNLATKVGEVKKKTETQIRNDLDEVQKRSEEIKKELGEKKDASEARKAEDVKVLDQEVKNFRGQKNLEQAEYHEYNRQLEALTQREIERANISVEIDGHVVKADVVANSIVIDRGTAAGVREGFRFECFAMHAGNKKVHKAYLEVKRAQPNVSECMVVAKVVRLPRDPLSNYVAPEPEYLFSPYQDANKGKGSSGLQGLTAQPKKVITGMNAEDPIVEGDLIQNPFYSPHKSYTFYVSAGAVREIVKGQQKSSIAYQWPHIERVLRSYGANVVNKVELGVDYVIAQKNPTDDPEFNKAVTLGIPVIYEWELFRFLDQQ